MNTPVKKSPVVFCPAPGDTVCNAEGYSAEYVGPFDFGHVVRPIFENRDDDGAPWDIVSTVPVIWTDVFPGDACPKMAAEIEEQRAILVALRKQVQEARQDMSSTQSARAENDRLRAALERVAKWYGEFPDTGRQWDDGEAMSFTACFGSDGAREYMRDVARLALLPVETPDHG